MVLQVISHRGIRLNDGLKSLRYGSNYVSNESMPYPGVEVYEDDVDLSVNAFENTLAAIKTAWILGYKVETDVYTYGVIHHDRMIGRNPARLIDHMTPEQIAQVNLSTTGDKLHDGNRIPMLAELLDLQASIKREGKNPPPRMQLELKKPADVSKVVGDVMERIASGQIDASDMRITSFNYELLQQARQLVDTYPENMRPELGYLVVSEALDYAYLDSTAPDYAQQLKEQAGKVIPVFFRERLALEGELAQYFPELAGQSLEQMEQAIPALVDQYGVGEFKKRYEGYLGLFIGGGMEAGYRLVPEALANAPFDIVHIPMDAARGVAEAYKADLDKITYRAGKLRANAHSVASGGRNPSQVLRAFLLLDDDGEFTLDYPGMVPTLFGSILKASGPSSGSSMTIGFDPTRKLRLDGTEFTQDQVEFAAKRFLDIIDAPYKEVSGAQSRIGPGGRGNKLEVEKLEPSPASGSRITPRRRAEN